MDCLVKEMGYGSPWIFMEPSGKGEWDCHLDWGGRTVETNDRAADAQHGDGLSENAGAANDVSPFDNTLSWDMLPVYRSL